MKNIAILGSTGSIGQQTLDVIRANPNKFRVVALSAGNNRELLARQAAEFAPSLVTSLPESPLPVAIHPDADLVVCAIVGNAGLEPTIAAINAGKPVALANKETLVCAGERIMALAREKGVDILPIDSEHYAVSECLRGRSPQEVSKIILTASGGALFGKSRSELENVTPADALAHPNWRMGAKITVDSATLMNKALEVIEAHHLFDVPFDKIEVVIHRESIIHSMVEFTDGSIIAHLAMPDMRLPIHAALAHPEKAGNSPAQIPRINFAELGKLTFYPPDRSTFECLQLGIDAGKKGGKFPEIMNNANEEAVALFLAGELKFLDIPRYIREKLNENGF
ncbi:MAG: 1-deoxy-D-xylulose-5-phosphate reductoisomerase [Clostridiales bacterium]|jgi:1-deoxy-D-xylulose-5-phosphate reductoisomerase|nr:1-deoxy-D-xylulose-5-phosphate reductoisomerase [Clostridiales bacterium]